MVTGHPNCSLSLVDFGFRLGRSAREGVQGHVLGGRIHSEGRELQDMVGLGTSSWRWRDVHRDWLTHCPAPGPCVRESCPYQEVRRTL